MRLVVNGRSDNAAFASGNLDLSLWGKNLTDQGYYIFGFGVPGLNTGIATYGEPRTYRCLPSGIALPLDKVVGP